MSSIIVEIENPEITQLGVEAIIDFYRTLAIAELSIPGLNAFATGVHSSSLNVVLDTREKPLLEPQLVKTIRNFFANYQLPWGWFFTEISQPENIETEGFQLLYEAPSLYLNLANKLPDKDKQIEIREMQDDLFSWIEPLQEGFPSVDNCAAYRNLNATLVQKKEKKLRHFTAFINNEAATSGTLFLSDKAVMVHNLATKNKFKKSGLASALTLHLLHEAQAAGYQHCFLDSSDEGFHLYTRLGFKVYGVTSVYEPVK